MDHQPATSGHPHPLTPAAPAERALALETTDPAGQTIHHWCAIATAVLISFPTTPLEFALAPPLVFTIIRFPKLLPLIAAHAKQPLTIAITAFAAWSALALLWSPDRAEGTDELIRLRWLLLPALLAPVALVEHRRRALIWAFALGVALGHITQVLNAAAMALDWSIFRWGRAPSRISGWWDPAVAGTLLTAAVATTAPAAIGARARTRIIAAVLCAAAAIGLLATGSRGGWLATAALLAILIPTALFRRVTGLRPINLIATLTAAAILFAAATAALWPKIEPRIDAAISEVDRAINNDDYRSDTGKRILMKERAAEAFADHPIAGTGTGGYRAWNEANHGSTRFVHAHAHDTWMHLLATQGLIGTALFATLLALAIHAAFRAAKHNSANSPREWSIHHGPAWALLGLALVTPFDTLTVSNHSAALLGLILALAYRPAIAHKKP